MAIARCNADGTRGPPDIHAVHVWAENPGVVKNDYFFDKHATEWVINKMRAEYPDRVFKGVTKCVDGCAGQYKSKYALCGLEILRQVEIYTAFIVCILNTHTHLKDTGLEFIEQVFGASGDFKGQHDSEGGDAQRCLSEAEKRMQIRCQTVWQAFVFISQPTIFQPKTFGGKRSKHGVLKRWHAFICDKTEATAEQLTRSADRGDVIIVDGATRWDGEKCEGIKNEYLMRADRAPQKDVKEPGTVATRDLFCCCPACLVGDFRSCEFITETGNFRRRNWTRQTRPPTALKKVKSSAPAVSDHSAAASVGGGAVAPVVAACAGAGAAGGGDFLPGDGVAVPAADGEPFDDNFDGDEEDLGVEEVPELPQQCRWVQCSKRTCGKWRRLPDGDDGAWCVGVRRWECKQNGWNDFDSCDVEEEIYDVA